MPYEFNCLMNLFVGFLPLDMKEIEESFNKHCHFQYLSILSTIVLPFFNIINHCQPLNHHWTTIIRAACVLAPSKAPMHSTGGPRWHDSPPGPHGRSSCWTCHLKPVGFPIGFCGNTESSGLHDYMHGDVQWCSCIIDSGKTQWRLHFSRVHPPFAPEFLAPEVL